MPVFRQHVLFLILHFPSYQDQTTGLCYTMLLVLFGMHMMLPQKRTFNSILALTLMAFEPSACKVLKHANLRAKTGKESRPIIWWLKLRSNNTIPVNRASRYRESTRRLSIECWKWSKPHLIVIRLLASGRRPEPWLFCTVHILKLLSVSWVFQAHSLQTSKFLQAVLKTLRDLISNKKVKQSSVFIL